MSLQVKSETSEQKTYECKCPNCEASNDHTVPFWESIVLYNLGIAPKFIGCYSCGEMTRVTKDKS